MNTIADLRRAVYNWVDKELKEKIEGVIWQDQGKPRPARPYVGLRIISGPSVNGSDDIDQVTPGVYRYIGQRALTVQISIYGENALDIAHQLDQSLQRETILEVFRGQNISVINDTGIQNLTVPIDAQTFESRAQFEVEFGFVTSSDADVGFVEDVGYTGIDGKPGEVNS